MARGQKSVITRAQGFTIVALLIVIVVIAILAAIAIVGLQRHHRARAGRLHEG
jgi:type II secretory pathway pseudopilin PulG